MPLFYMVSTLLVLNPFTHRFVVFFFHQQINKNQQHLLPCILRYHSKLKNIEKTLGTATNSNHPTSGTSNNNNKPPTDKYHNDNIGKSKSLPGIDVVLGSQWGDEGKGKLVDLLSQVSQSTMPSTWNGMILLWERKQDFTHLCHQQLLDIYTHWLEFTCIRHLDALTLPITITTSSSSSLSN